MNAMVNLADLQGNILRGYTKKPYVRYLILEVADRVAARRWFAASTSGRNDGVPQITSGDWGASKPDTCFNIGLTYEGLRALGTPIASLEMFPNEFIEGMTARAGKLAETLQRAQADPSHRDDLRREGRAAGRRPEARPRRHKRRHAARHPRGLQLPR
ncbi:hypothetical protein [Bradyrhizobium sp. 2S1]|uniref:hypothetical protein n=1 Tax=Bradyrhizobium sp. 2S1 TaxID=1404429 RepID=UPI0014096B46|nr:hypothetical protein [Bradyrhizobium sp. 2S1]MCK7665346.1 hypothetical protein [Bradyrhizobium sp. 2S1]